MVVAYCVYKHHVLNTQCPPGFILKKSASTFPDFVQMSNSLLVARVLITVVEKKINEANRTSLSLSVCLFFCLPASFRILLSNSNWEKHGEFLIHQLCGSVPKQLLAASRTRLFTTNTQAFTIPAPWSLLACQQLWASLVPTTNLSLAPMYTGRAPNKQHALLKAINPSCGNGSYEMTDHRHLTSVAFFFGCYLF